jgi:hypothetical protein
VKHQGGFARCRWALERRGAHSDHHGPAGEVRQCVPQPNRPGDRVELVAALGESRRRVDVVVGSERDHPDIRFIGADIGGNDPSFRIDRRNQLLAKPDAGFDELPVWQPHGAGRRVVEHQIELGEAEDERVALVDQGDVDVFAESLREHGGQLEAAEAGAEDDDARCN